MFAQLYLHYALCIRVCASAVFCCACVRPLPASPALTVLCSPPPSLFPLPFIPQQGYASNKVQVLPKEHGNRALLISCRPRPRTARIPLSRHFSSPSPFNPTPPPPPFSFFQTVIPFFTSPYLVPTFHQLLVPPNSCHVDVEGLGTFHPRTLQMWLIKVEGGVGTARVRVRGEKVTGSCIKLLHLGAISDKRTPATSLQGGHKCIMALRSA